jgi:uncharacterized ferredoxin-like protein
VAIIKEESFRPKVVAEVAEQMCVAARTAPKAKGLDLLEIAVVCGEAIAKLADKMRELGGTLKRPGFLRDAENIRSAQAIVLIGTKKKTVGLDCAFCGRPTCADAEKAGVVCSYNPGDLGIAIGSAVSVAADNRLDSRVMYSIGKTAVAMKLLGAEVIIAFGIPLSATAKNPFFDRK